MTSITWRYLSVDVHKILQNLTSARRLDLWLAARGRIRQVNYDRPKYAFESYLVVPKDLPRESLMLMPRLSVALVLRVTTCGCICSIATAQPLTNALACSRYRGNETTTWRKLPSGMGQFQPRDGSVFPTCDIIWHVFMHAMYMSYVSRGNKNPSPHDVCRGYGIYDYQGMQVRRFSINSGLLVAKRSNIRRGNWSRRHGDQMSGRHTTVWIGHPR